MANLLSPGVQVTEVDMSQVIPAEGDSAAVFGGDFEKGPIGVHTLISNVQELREHYGYPTTRNYNDYYQVQNFLAYSGAIYVSRAADINGTPTKIDNLFFNDNAYVTNANIEKIEDVKFLEKDSVDITFEKTNEFKIGQILKFGDSNQEFKIKYLRNEVRQIPNPDYKPLTTLFVDFDNTSLTIDEVSSYVIQTNAESYEITTTDPSIVLVNKSNKSITGLKEGETSLIFTAEAENCRANTFEVKISVTQKEQTGLVVEPEALTIAVGAYEELQITTDATNYTIISKNLGIAAVEFDKKTIKGIGEGTTEIEVTAIADGMIPTTKSITVTVEAEQSDQPIKGEGTETEGSETENPENPGTETEGSETENPVNPGTETEASDK